MMPLDLYTHAESWNMAQMIKSLFIITIIDTSQVLILKVVNEIISVSRNKTARSGNEKNIQFILLKA